MANLSNHNLILPKNQIGLNIIREPGTVTDISAKFNWTGSEGERLPVVTYQILHHRFILLN